MKNSFILGGEKGRKQGSENPADLLALICWSISAFSVSALAPLCLAQTIPHAAKREGGQVKESGLFCSG